MKKTVSKAWLYVSVILALVAASAMLEQHKIRKELKNVFHYSYHITVVDDDTGDILNPSIAHPGMSTKDLFAQTTGTASHFDGTVTISGVGYTLRTFSFGHDGYQPRELTIRPDSGFTDDVEIRLKRSKPEPKSE